MNPPPFPEIPATPESRLRWAAWGEECARAERERAEKAKATVAAFRDATKDAPDILDLMIRCSKTSCPPMHYLLTHDGLYGFHMANLWVRNDGKEYTMEADWADSCGKLVKRLTELLQREPA